MVDRLETMTEDQVLRGLQEVGSARKVWAEEFAQRLEELPQPGPWELPRMRTSPGYTREQLDDLASTQIFFQTHLNSLKNLRSQARTRTRSGGISPFDPLEDALNERLESLRKLTPRPKRPKI
jgi:hypothetical protein